MSLLVALVAGIGGVVLGAWLTRRNERRAHGDRLLTEAVNDIVAAIADVAGGDASAQPRYAASQARLALHGSPELIEAFRQFQTDATTTTTDGRHRLILAVLAARRELGRADVDESAVSMLMFGHTNSPGPQD